MRLYSFLRLLAALPGRFYALFDLMQPLDGGKEGVDGVQNNIVGRDNFAELAHPAFLLADAALLHVSVDDGLAGGGQERVSLSDLESLNLNLRPQLVDFRERFAR